eukprot:scaffold5490_cov148-Skeletonema_marinoi.AAC.1
MVVRNDEPDIIVGVDPSAPPMATAVPVTAFNNPNKNIERTTNADGSIAIKATTTSRRPNGYRDVTIEYFYVPANMADTVIMSMDSTGEPPSSLYLTKMEQQVLPPGTGEVMSHAPSAPQTTTGATAAAVGGGGNPVPQPYIHEDTVVGGSHQGSCAVICGCVFILVVAVGVIVGVRGINHTKNPNYWPTPAPYNWNPTPWYDPPTPKPTRVGCKDTPGWVDNIGFGCDKFDWSYSNMCSLPGPMGPGTRHCCACGGGSTYVAPTPQPSRAPIISPPPTPRPTQSPACKDTPNWSDMFGSGCNSYTFVWSCDVADTYQGSMGSANENCCVCGGGTVPSDTSKAPATSNTAVPSTTPTNPVAVAVPTLVNKNKQGENELDSKLSNNNPFRSPSAAKAKED